MAQLNFDASTVNPNTALDPIPSGWYPMIIKESEIKPTKDKTGAYLELTLEVIEGEYKGRKVWDRLNLQNKNPVAVEIAYSTLSAICHAVNIFQVQDSQQLHGLPLDVKVKLKPADENYDASNEVRGYRQLATAGSKATSTGAPPWAQQQAPQQPQQQQQQAPPLEQQAPPPIPPWEQSGQQQAPQQQPSSTPPWEQQQPQQQQAPPLEQPNKPSDRPPWEK